MTSVIPGLPLCIHTAFPDHTDDLLMTSVRPIMTFEPPPRPQGPSHPSYPFRGPLTQIMGRGYEVSQSSNIYQNPSLLFDLSQHRARRVQPRQNTNTHCRQYHTKPLQSFCCCIVSWWCYILCVIFLTKTYATILIPKNNLWLFIVLLAIIHRQKARPHC